MKKVVFLLAACAFLNVSAQYSKASAGAFGFGVQTIDTSPLRQFNTQAPTLSEAGFSFSGYGYYQFSDFLAGFSFGGVYSNEASDADNLYSYAAGYFTLDFGYKIINRNKWALYPILHGGYAGLAYSTESTKAVTVGGETPQFTGVTYNWDNLVYGASLRFERYLGMKEQCDGQKGAGLLGFEVGYLTSPSSADWTTTGRAAVIGAPEYKLNSFFARITLGGFGAY